MNIRNLLLSFLALPLVLATGLEAQQWDDPERRSLIKLRTFAVHAQVHVSARATLEKIDESVLRARMESAMRREGIGVQGPGDVRDGSQAQISLVYLVLETGPDAAGETGFAASSCLQATQLVTIPRLSVGRITYTMAPTWSSCGMIVGGRESFRASILQNADQQIDRFLSDWRKANPPRPAAPVVGNPELGTQTDRRTGGRAVGRSGHASDCHPERSEGAEQSEQNRRWSCRDGLAPSPSLRSGSG
jgi:hypothetical protein